MTSKSLPCMRWLKSNFPSPCPVSNSSTIWRFISTDFSFGRHTATLQDRHPRLMLAPWVPSLGEHKSDEQRQFFSKPLFLRLSRAIRRSGKTHQISHFRGTLCPKTRKTMRRSGFGGALGERLCELAYLQVCPKCSTCVRVTDAASSSGRFSTFRLDEPSRPLIASS
jgi:hypothetical protein